MPGYVSSNFIFSIKKKNIPVLNRGAQRKLGVGRHIMVMTTVKLNGKTRYIGSIPGSYDKNAYKLSEKNSKKIPKPLYKMVMGEEAPWK
jgi:hypothetical protein